MKTLTFTLTVDIEPWFDHEKTDDEWIEYMIEHLITDAHVIGPDDELTEVRGYELTLPKNDNPHAVIGGGYDCDLCGQRHGGSSVHCLPTIDELLTAHGQNTDR
jgi:hypothetical protein